MFYLRKKEVFYFKLLNYDSTRVVISYFIQTEDKLLEIYTFLNKESFNADAQKLSDDIIKSIKINK